MQYNIRLHNETEITVSEYFVLLSGIMPETPLGKIVSIRAEKDTKTITKMSKYEKKIRSEWFSFNDEKNIQNGDMVKINNLESIEALQKMLEKMFGSD